ncbi:MAG TPA: DegV family protein [Candidatus Dormibacteraeota bacterium]|nr:DegV family protein [Candidatus Dormibacteraeota bacterium]
MVDSSTCLDEAEAARLSTAVVPLQLVIDGRTYRDVVDILRRDFYRSLRAGHSVHTTASPSVGDYLRAFRQAPGDVLCLTVAASLSSMFQNAQTAADLARQERPQRRIRVVDTGTAAAGLRLLAVQAGRLAARGSDLGEVVERVTSLAPRVVLLGVLETVAYLARSGRVPQVASRAVELLGLRPVVRFARGEGGLVHVARSPEAGLRALQRSLMQAARDQGMGAEGEGLEAVAFHADAGERMEALLARLRTRLPRAQLAASEFTPAMGVHTGPGLVGVAFFVHPRDGVSDPPRTGPTRFGENDGRG